MKPDTRVLDSDRVFVDEAVREIVDAMEQAWEKRGACHLALAGGTTPRPVYRALARSPLLQAADWSRVHVYFGDERCVPPADGDSNFGMARATLLDRVPVPPEQVHRMRGEDPDRRRAARAYEAALPERLDLLILGVGPDGHTASLFPGGAALSETTRLVLPADAPFEPRARLTVTPPVIETARRVLVLVRGASKAVAVRAALAPQGDVAETPARLARRGIWIVDAAAASGLAGGDP